MDEISGRYFQFLFRATPPSALYHVFEVFVYLMMSFVLVSKLEMKLENEKEWSNERLLGQKLFFFKKSGVEKP